MAVVFVQVLTVPLNNVILHYLLAEGALAWVSPALAKVDRCTRMKFADFSQPISKPLPHNSKP